MDESMKMPEVLNVQIGNDQAQVIDSVQPVETFRTQNHPDNPALHHFCQQLTKILSETETKIRGETSILNADLSAGMAATIQRATERHTEEKEELLQEVDKLHLCVDSLESTLNVKSVAAEKIMEKLQHQTNLVICSKAFYSWRLFLQNKKREDFLNALAVRYYETSLKRKAFRLWHAQLRARWKKRLELQAHIDVVEMQKRITNMYEVRIRNLEDNLSAAGKKIDNLQSQRKLCDDSATSYRPNYLQMHLDTVNYRKDFFNPMGDTFVEKAPLKAAIIDASLCPECAVEQNNAYRPIPMPSSSYHVGLSRDPRPETTSAQGPPWRAILSPGRKEADSLQKSDRLVIRHVPGYQHNASAKSSSRPQSSKSSREKKFV